MKNTFSRYFFRFTLGLAVVLTSFGGVTYASLNNPIPVPPAGMIGDILTADGWNKIIQGIRDLDERTSEVKSNDTSGNTAVGINTADPSEEPQEKLDVRGAVKIGTTTKKNTGTIRYNGSDFEGYTANGWKSLTKGSDDPCSATETTDWTDGIASASCDVGIISYSSVEWKAKEGKLFPSFAISTTPGNAQEDSLGHTNAQINCLGNECKVHLICCEGRGTGDSAGGGSDNFGNHTATENIELNGNWLSGDSDNEGVFVGPDGKVGIGTSNPGAQLEIYGGGDILLKDDRNDAGDLIFQDSEGRQKGRIWTKPNGANGESGLLLSSQDNTADISILDNGDVYMAGKIGLGTNEPSAKLQVFSSKTISDNANDFALIGRFERRGEDGNQNKLDILTIRDEDKVSEVDSWNSIGTRIQAVTDNTEQAYIQFNGTGNGYGLSFGTGGDSNGYHTTTERMRISRDGDVGIGTTNPSSELEVVGTVTATSFSENSDERLKENIETIQSPLEKVEALRGVTFDWKKDGESSVGFIAQEVEEVLPEIVNTAEDGFKSVQYSNVTAVLVEALKEQQTQIETLNAKNKELEEKINKILENKK